MQPAYRASNPPAADPRASLYRAEVLPCPPPSGALRAFAGFAMQDWLVALYVTVLTLLVLTGDGPRRPTALGCVALDNALFWGGVLTARSGLVRSRLASGLFYRAGLIGVVIVSFFQLQYIQPVAIHAAYDDAIHAIDLAVFGFEPAVTWDRFVTPATTEWFAFFYFSYFFLVLAYTIPLMLFERRIRIISEFSAGILWVVCVGHLVYFLVPGRGPYVHLAHEVSRPLTGSLWWPAVQATVGFGEEVSRRDIFPSLHTALPTFLTLCSFRLRRERPFNWVWPPMAFITSQIILATMFLRWHYLLDIVAGLALAVSAALGARALVPAEARSRAQFGLEPVWLPLVARGWRRRRGAVGATEERKDEKRKGSRGGVDPGPRPAL